MLIKNTVLRIGRSLIVAVMAIVMPQSAMAGHAWADQAATGQAKWPQHLSTADFLDRAAADNSFVVDIRHLMERPRQVPLTSISVVRLPWPGEAGHARTPAHLSAFFKQLKILRRRHPGQQLVLLCGVGSRSVDVMKRAPDFGLKSGLSQLIGGLEGNDGDPGLLLELSFR